MLYREFCGGLATERSPNVNAARSINWMPVSADAGDPKAPVWLCRTPGLWARWFLGGGPIRSLYEQDGRCFAIGGATLYELFPNNTALFRGIVALDGAPATFSSNYTVTSDGDPLTADGGNQLFITSGGLGYIYDLIANTLTQITDDAFPVPCTMGLFFDGYFVALHGATGAFYISDLGDGLAWNGTDFGLESQVSDRTRAIVRTHDNLWLFGQKHTAPWCNTGNANFPFAPIQGTIIEHGVDAVWSIAKMDNTLIWLGRDENGAKVVWRANGYTPQRISTHALEFYLSRLPRTDNAIAYPCLEEGHLFYVLYLPNAPTTPVYDVTTGLWHERAIWDPIDLRFYPHLSRCHAFAFGKHLVGDRQSGVVYEMGLDRLTDSLVAVA